MILVSWTNLEAVKLLPWRAPDYGGLPTVKMVYLTLFTQLFEDIPQLGLQLLYLSSCGIGTFSLSEDVAREVGSGLDGICSSDAIALIACFFSSLSLAWQLLRKSLIIFFVKPTLKWSSFNEHHVTIANQLTGSVISKGVFNSSGKRLGAVLGSYIHERGCHSWQVSIGSRIDEGKQSLPVRIGICDAANFDPSTGTGSLAWGIDPFTRIFYESDDSFHPGTEAIEQPFRPAGHVGAIPCSTVRVLVDMERQRLCFQFDNGRYVDCKVEIDADYVCAWCIAGSDELTIDQYVNEKQHLRLNPDALSTMRSFTIPHVHRRSSASSTQSAVLRRLSEDSNSGFNTDTPPPPPAPKRVRSGELLQSRPPSFREERPLSGREEPLSGREEEAEVDDVQVEIEVAGKEHAKLKPQDFTATVCGDSSSSMSSIAGPRRAKQPPRNWVRPPDTIVWGSELGRGGFGIVFQVRRSRAPYAMLT